MTDQPLVGREQGCRLSLTALFAAVKSNENTHYSGHDEEETEEIKFQDVFSECSALVRVEVEEVEQNSCGDTASWPCGKLSN